MFRLGFWWPRWESTLALPRADPSGEVGVHQFLDFSLFVVFKDSMGCPRFTVVIALTPQMVRHANEQATGLRTLRRLHRAQLLECPPTGCESCLPLLVLVLLGSDDYVPLDRCCRGRGSGSRICRGLGYRVSINPRLATSWLRPITGRSRRERKDATADGIFH